MTSTQQSTSRAARRDLPELGTLRSGLHGQVCLRGDPGYDEARSIWNAMIDRFPDVVVRCADAEDVIRAVRFATAYNLAIAVRGGGHNIAGNAIGEGGLLIDLSPMKAVQVDQKSQRVRVGPGVGDDDRLQDDGGLDPRAGVSRLASPVP